MSSLCRGEIEHKSRLLRDGTETFCLDPAGNPVSPGTEYMYTLCFIACGPMGALSKRLALFCLLDLMLL